MIKLMKHYVTDGVRKARVHYSHAVLTNGKEAVTLYAKDYESGRMLGEMFSESYENNTDIMTDYFEKGRVRIYKDNPLFSKAIERSPKYQQS